MALETKNLGLYLEDNSTTKFKEWRDKMNGPTGSNMEILDDAIASKQDKITGTQGQVVGFDENGNAVPQAAPDTGVTTFNGRTGAVKPQSGDYTPDQVGALASDGTAVAATKLATAQTLEGVSFDGTATITHYGTCSTAAATAAKTVTLTGFSLATGARVEVKFTYANTAANPTLNANGTGAKAIKKYGTTAADANMWAAGAVVQFVYDGTNWVMENGTTATKTYYGLTKLSSAVNSDSEELAATPKAVKEAYDLAAGRQTKLTGTQGQSIGFNASGAAVPVRGWSNENLIRNWYFGRPVNQRGQKEYKDNVYTIDGWRLAQNAESSVVIEDGYILLSLKGIGIWNQTFDNNLEPGIYTFSFLEKDEGLFSVNINWPASGSVHTSVYVAGIRVALYVNPDSIMFFANNTDFDLKLVAAKLELGDQQTLAHQDASGNWVLNDPPPDPALELLKCQRYQYEVNTMRYLFPYVGTALAGTSTSAFGMVELPVVMNKIPAVITTGKWRLLGKSGTNGSASINVSNITVHSSSSVNGMLNRIMLTITVDPEETKSLEPGNFYYLSGNGPVNDIPTMLFDAN